MAAAVTDAYATPDEYRTAVGKSDAGDDQALAADLKAISRWLDRKLNRFFTRDAADVPRTFYARSSMSYGQLGGGRPVDWAETENPFLWGGYARWLYIDDVVSVTSVIIDLNNNGLFEDAPLTSTNYELWPTNAALGPEPAPYTAIFIPNYSTQFGFPTGHRIQVTGRWGWPAVPPAIARATIELCAIKRLESPRSTSRINEMDQVVSTSKVAQDIIRDLAHQYTRKESLV